MRGRVEATAKQQLAELRRAHEHYLMLAAQLRDGADTAIDADQQRALAQNASRIAEAYKKSIDNSRAQMDRRSTSDEASPPIARLAVILAVIVSIIVGGALAVVYRPTVVSNALAFVSDATTFHRKIAATIDIQLVSPPALKSAVPSPAREDREISLHPAPLPSEARAAMKVTPTKPSKSIYLHAEALGATVVEARKSSNRKLIAGLLLQSPNELANGSPESKAGAVEPTYALTPAAPSEVQVPAVNTRDSALSVEQGISQVELSMTDAGLITECRLVKSSGSMRLDDSACTIVRSNWRAPVSAPGKITAPSTITVSVVWNVRL
ncbi:MAG: energy transducer TonB [Pseudomonadota bacterium]